MWNWRMTGQLVAGLAAVAVMLACGSTDEPPKKVAVDRAHPLDGLPGDAAAPGSGPAVIGGHIAYQLPFLPIAFSIDTEGKFRVAVKGSLVTPLGTVTISGGIAKNLKGQTLGPEAVDVTQLIICKKGTKQKTCEAFQIASGRKIRIDMNGQFVQEVERNRITIEAAPGSEITVTDVAPPASKAARGPATIGIMRTHFYETSKETDIDLESGFGGVKADLTYDHVTGELKPINGARLSWIHRHSREDWDVHDNGFWGNESVPVPKEFFPGEEECLKTPDGEWKESFAAEDLQASAVVACIKTVEGDLGYVVVRPAGGKPIGYHVFSRIWIR